MNVNSQNRSERIGFYAVWLIGAVGALGQSKILSHMLVDSYPYKMMEMPPQIFYFSIYLSASYVSPIFALVIATFMASKSTVLRRLPVIAVVLCPLIYWLIFEGYSITSPYQGELMLQRNFEGYTGETARYAFGFEVLSLIFWGSIIAFVADVFVNYLVKLFTKNAPVP